MTYGVQRMTFTGNTLCDKLKAEFGERTAVSLNLGREANARRAARSTTPARPAAKRTVNQATAKSRSAHMSNNRESVANRNAQTVRRAANQTARPAVNRRPNIMRDTVVHKMAKPVSDRTPLETSVSTFSKAYRRGEKIREYAAAERAKPHARHTASAKAENKSIVVAFFAWGRKFLFGEKSRAEVRVKKSPFPIGMIALLCVCTIMVMVMMNSFAQLYEFRKDISTLETKQAQLRADETRLSGLVEAKEDVRIIEQTATEELGMVSSDLAKSRFVSLTSEDRVEVKNTAATEDTGTFATLLSAIGENLGGLSEYFN